VPNVDILILAILRGVSEILPIDPAAHAALLRRLLCWPEQAAWTAAAADAGILLALLVFLWRDVLGMARGLARSLRGKRDPGVRLLAQLLVGSLPAFAITCGLRFFLAVEISDPVYVAVLLVAFAVVLYVADQAGLTVRRLEQMNLGQAAIIGVLQGLAVLPGVSRVGIIVTAGRILGYERPDAARFMLLLSLPWMAGSGLYRAWLGLASGVLPDGERLLLTAAIAAIAAFLAVVFLMYWVRRGSLTLFAVYRVLIGGALLYALYRLPLPAC
jgi:undecaprenyl-diphosphatase